MFTSFFRGSKTFERHQYILKISFLQEMLIILKSNDRLFPYVIKKAPDIQIFYVRPSMTIITIQMREIVKYIIIFVLCQERMTDKLTLYPLLLSFIFCICAFSSCSGVFATFLSWLLPSKKQRNCVKFCNICWKFMASPVEGFKIV